MTSYKTYNLNWLLVAQNKNKPALWLDYAHFDIEAAGRAFRTLKTHLFGPDFRALFIGTNRFLPLRDYILYNFNAKFQQAQKELIQGLFEQENLSDVFKKDTFVVDEISLESFDFITPSFFHQEMSQSEQVTYYVLPIKINCLDDQGEHLLKLAQGLESQEKIKELIRIFKGTEFIKSVMDVAGSDQALIPILKENSLRKMIGNIQEMVKKYDTKD